MSITRREFTGLAAGVTAALMVGTLSASAGESRTGQLSGRQGYKVKGTVKVEKEGDQIKVVLGDDYLFDPEKNPPDIKIGFGTGEEYAEGSKIHDELTVKEGEASFIVPEGIDPDQYDELYIYCEQFTVILAVAPLS